MTIFFLKIGSYALGLHLECLVLSLKKLDVLGKTQQCRLIAFFLFVNGSPVSIGLKCGQCLS